MNSTTPTQNQPRISIKDGVIQLTVWENRKKDGTLIDSRRFSPPEFD